MALYQSDSGDSDVVKKLSWFLPPCLCYIFHLLVPGGLLESHNAVIFLLSIILCFIHFFTSVSQSILKFCAVIPVGMLVFVAVAILFGAHPSKLSENLTWALLMAVLVCLPVLRLPTDADDGSYNWKSIFLHTKQEYEVLVVSVATLVGAWVGAFPILLDWNKPWQEWPIPCSVGAIIGNTCGYLFSITLTK